MKYKLDIIIPVYNEGKNIILTLQSLYSDIRNDFNIYICYDFEEDDTLNAISSSIFSNKKNIFFIKNSISGAHSAVMAGIKHSNSKFILVMPADDDYNSKIIDPMIKKAINYDLDIICPSRFIKGGSMKGASFMKMFLVLSANFTLKYLAGMPVSDSTNGFRMFSKKLIDNINIESTVGFTYSIEYLVKAHRYGYKISEIPALWHERKYGKSNFQLYKWIFPYLTWYFYAFKTSILKIIKL